MIKINKLSDDKTLSKYSLDIEVFTTDEDEEVVSVSITDTNDKPVYSMIKLIDLDERDIDLIVDSIVNSSKNTNLIKSLESLGFEEYYKSDDVDLSDLDESIIVNTPNNDKPTIRTPLYSDKDHVKEILNTLHTKYNTEFVMKDDGTACINFLGAAADTTTSEINSIKDHIEVVDNDVLLYLI